MKIRLNRNRKVELLKALQDGELDPIIVCRWFAESIELMTDEDLQVELDQIKKELTAADRQRIKTLSVCVGCEKWLVDNGRHDLSRLTNDELTELINLFRKCTTSET